MQSLKVKRTGIGSADCVHNLRTGRVQQFEYKLDTYCRTDCTDCLHCARLLDNFYLPIELGEHSMEYSNVLINRMA